MLDTSGWLILHSVCQASVILSEVTTPLQEMFVYTMKILQYLITYMYAAELGLREFYAYRFVILWRRNKSGDSAGISWHY
jgi:hypothetical protein